MSIKAKLIFKEHIPFRFENELCTTRGFHVVYRLNGGGVCLQKGWASDDEELEAMYKEDENADDLPWGQDCARILHPSDNDPEPENWWDLPKARQDEIEKKCERIFDSFVEPYRQPDEIKAQLKMMAQRCHFTSAEYEFVDNWIYCNVM